ncbi:MAG: BadF/BadG/BcrA/BcrD ATPase family protein [Vicinamibacterales bacterium]
MVLGIDAGGTKTVCQLADENGRIIAESRGPGANLQAAGELAVEKTLHNLMDEAMAAQAEANARVDAICVGMAGVDRPSDAQVVRGIMRRIGGAAKVLIVNDALVALEAGAPGAAGVVVIAGTGSICYGRNDKGQAARAGGWGYVLGDEGSGYWIGRHALRAVVREADRRGPRTSLTPKALAHFGVDRPQDLIHEIYYGGMKPGAIAALASAVQAAFVEGDAVAAGILEVGVRELVSSAASVVERLHLDQEPFTFVLSGGIFRAVPWMREQLAVRLGRVAPDATIIHLGVEPAEGAVRLAMALVRGDARVPVYVDAAAP